MSHEHCVTRPEIWQAFSTYWALHVASQTHRINLSSINLNFRILLSINHHSHASVRKAKLSSQTLAFLMTRASPQKKIPPPTGRQATFSLPRCLIGLSTTSCEPQRS